MKIKELIVELQKFDQEKEIVLVVEPYCGKAKSIYIDDNGKFVISTEK
jgi:hypothetical protein